VKPYPDLFFDGGYNSDFILLGKSLMGYSRDYFSFLEKLRSSLEDLVLFLYKYCWSYKEFSMVWQYHRLGEDFYWSFNFFNPSFEYDREVFKNPSIIDSIDFYEDNDFDNISHLDLSSVFSDLSLSDNGKSFTFSYWIFMHCRTGVVRNN